MVLIKLRHRKKTVLGDLEGQIRGCRDHRLASLAVAQSPLEREVTAGRQKRQTSG